MILLLLLSIQTGIQPFLQQKFIAEDIHVPSIVAIQEVVREEIVRDPAEYACTGS